MARLRRLPFAGSAAIITSIGLTTLGCSGDTGSNSDPAGGMASAQASGMGTSANGQVGNNPTGMNNGTVGGNNTATAGGGAANTPGTGQVGAGATAATPAGGGAATVPGTDTPVPNTGTCQVGVPATSQVPRLTNSQYNSIVQDVLGVTSPTGSWADGFEPDSKGELSNSQWNNYQTAADAIAAAVMAAPLGGDLTTAAGDSATMSDAIKSLGRQMFRRPLSDDEVNSFMSLMDVQPAGQPDEIASALVYTMLISPSFLMRLELDAPEEMVPGTDANPQMAFKLSDYEVASRLSFLIWNTVPDETLNTAADNGELQTSDQIQAQAQRMLGDEFKDKVTPVIVAAHKFWANINDDSSISRWGKTPHDGTLFPEYAETQTATLMSEMDAFFAEVGYSGNFQDLFLSNVAYVNEDTAPLYGVEGVTGQDLQRVELDAAARPGFLTRGAFLSSFAHERDTSPILRGAFMITLMGGNVGTPDPNALKTPLPPGDYKTNREAITALTSVDPTCVACHQMVINPPGFVLENFSAVGSVQTTDPEYGGPIDTSVDSVAFPDGAKAVSTAQELMTGMAAGRMTKEIYATKWVSYATSRDANDFDKCTALAIADKIDAGSYNLASVLADITLADSFRYRVQGQ